MAPDQASSGWGLTLAVLTLLALAPPVVAQPRPQVPITGEGTEAFRAVLARAGLQALQSATDVMGLDPADVLVISFRSSERSGINDWLDTNGRQIHDGGVNGFIRAGGAVLFASDRARPPSAQSWTAPFGVVVSGEKVYAANAHEAFAGFGQCPFVQPRPRVEPDLFNGGALKVATNRPSYLELPRQVVTTLADIAPPAVRAGEQWQVKPLPFAQAYHNPFSGGRLLVLSDQSVFINSMMLPAPPAENDNLDFAFNCVSWLTQTAGDGKRKHVLLVNDNTVESDLNLILKALPPTTPEQILDYLREHPDEILDYLRKHPELITNNLDKVSPLVAALEDEGVFADLEESDIFNRTLLSAVPHWVIVRTVLVLGALALAGYGIRRFVGSRLRAPAGPRFATALERQRPRVGLLEQRLRAGLGSGQFYEAAREQARQTFAELGLTPAAHGPPPAYQIDAGWWSRRRIDGELQDIWRVAFGDEPEPVTAKQWAKWPARLKALREQVQAGVIRFVG